MGRGRVDSHLPMKTKTHFAFRVGVWDDTGDSIVEHFAGVDDFEVVSRSDLPGSHPALARGAHHGAKF
jgi:hypothetical protein